jgi:hypothetical protein
MKEAPPCLNCLRLLPLETPDCSSLDRLPREAFDCLSNQDERMFGIADPEKDVCNLIN